MSQTLQLNDKRTIIISIFPANKGLYTSVPSVYVDKEYLYASQNLIHTTTGTRRTRPGIDPYYTSGLGSGEAIKYLFDFWRTDSTTGEQNQQVVAVTNGRVFADEADGAFTSIGSVVGYDASKNITGDALVGFMVLGIEDQAPKKYIQAGSIADLGGSPPTGWLVRKHRSRVWLAGVKTAPHTLYYSAIEDPESWSGGTSGNLNIDLGASDPVGITSIFPEIFGELYIGKWESIYQIFSSTTTLGVRPLVSTIGNVSHNGTASIQNDIIFPSLRGLHSLQTTVNYGDVESSFLTFGIHDLWNSTVDFTRTNEMSAAFIPEFNSYLITYPKKNSSSYNLLGFNVVTKDFFLWEDFNASYITTFTDSDKRRRLLIGTSDANIGLMQSIDSTDFTDFLISFSSSFRTPRIFPNLNPTFTWGFKNLTVFFKPRGPNPIRVAYRIDNRLTDTVSITQDDVIGGTALGVFLLGSDILGQTNELVGKTVPINGYGTSIQLEMTSTPDLEEDGTAMEVLGYNIECEMTGDIKATIEV